MGSIPNSMYCRGVARNGSQGQSWTEIILDVPSTRNALSSAVVASLVAQLTEARSNTRSVAVIISGRGGGFCSGSDLKELRQLDGAAAARVEEAKLQLTSLIREFPVPVIAATHGYAIGGGAALAATCDLVVTTATTLWRMPEVSLGWAPPWGVDDVYRRMRAQALPFLIATAPRSGQEAMEAGLADIVDEAPLERARDVCSSLAETSRDAVTDVVSLIRSNEKGRYDPKDALRRFEACFEHSRGR